MSGVNKTILVGRVGQEVESKQVGDSLVVNFSLATSERYKDKSGETKTATEWHSIVIWRKLAEIAQKYVKKGDLLYIEGKLKTRSWEKDGQKFYKTEVVADQMTILGSKSQSEEPKQEQKDRDEDDLPF